MVVVVVTTPGPSVRCVDLLLCGHHFRCSRGVLEAMGALVLDRSGALVTGR
ncbi:hypothetical protein [Actinomadura gamaensis]|uniref:Uncharacterized protein n=1 Tax=Actinomadura gamaensis TaxID=1763541 RepID=A0ABV9U2H5_9ACTN